MNWRRKQAGHYVSHDGYHTIKKSNDPGAAPFAALWHIYRTGAEGSPLELRGFNGWSTFRNAKLALADHLRCGEA